MNNKKKTKAQRSNYQKYFPMIIFISILFMGVGYAVINSINLNIDGEAIAKEQSGVYITEATYHSNVNANTSSSKIINAYKNNLNSSITLTNTATSSITYKIVLYNSDNTDYVFERIKYLPCPNQKECTTYSNGNIKIETDIQKGASLPAGGNITIYITFSYKDTNNIDNTKLDSYISFIFTDATKTYLLEGSELNAKIKASTTNSIDNTVNKVIFGKYSDYSSLIDWSSYESFVDEGNTGTIRLFRIKNDKETTVYILSNNNIYSNPDSSRSFINLRAMSDIKFDNFNTSQVLDMTRMFYMFSDTELNYDSSLVELDLSMWDVYNTTNMRAMFAYNKKLEQLDISTWETINCTNMGYMFQELRSMNSLEITNFDTSNTTTFQGMFLGFSGLETLDLSSFDTQKVTEMTDMFTFKSPHTDATYTPELKTIYVSEKFVINQVPNKTVDMFTDNTALVGGNGTKYDSTKVSVEYATIDTASTKGYFTLKE